MVDGFSGLFEVDSFDSEVVYGWTSLDVGTLFEGRLEVLEWVQFDLPMNFLLIQTENTLQDLQNFLLAVNLRIISIPILLQLIALNKDPHHIITDAIQLLLLIFLEPIVIGLEEQLIVG